MVTIHRLFLSIDRYTVFSLGIDISVHFTPDTKYVHAFSDGNLKRHQFYRDNHEAHRYFSSSRLLIYLSDS